MGTNNFFPCPCARIRCRSHRLLKTQRLGPTRRGQGALFAVARMSKGLTSPVSRRNGPSHSASALTAYTSGALAGRPAASLVVVVSPRPAPRRAATTPLMGLAVDIGYESVSRRHPRGTGSGVCGEGEARGRGRAWRRRVDVRSIGKVTGKGYGALARSTGAGRAARGVAEQVWSAAVCR